MSGRHSHDTHHHMHDHEDPSHERRLWLALGLTLLFSLVEAATGWLTHSLALLGDAGHMFTDSSSLALAAVAARIARRPATRHHSYGMGRAEILAALVNILFMIAVVIVIVIEAVRRLQDPVPVSSLPVMAVALFGLGINVLVLLTLSQAQDNLNIRGAVLHVLGDMLGSVAALLSGIVIFFTQWWPIDALLSMLIALLILIGSIRLLREVLHVIMEGVPSHLDLNEIGHAIAGLPHVVSVHDLHIWSVSSSNVSLSAHLVLDNLKHWEQVLRATHTLLEERYHIKHVTLQPESHMHVLRPLPYERGNHHHVH